MGDDLRTNLVQLLPQRRQRPVDHPRLRPGPLTRPGTSGLVWGPVIPILPGPNTQVTCGAYAPVDPCRYRCHAVAASIYSTGVLHLALEFARETRGILLTMLQSGAIYRGVRREGDGSADYADGRGWDKVVLTGLT